MAIPIIYNIYSIKERWKANLIAVLGIAGVVAVFVAMLSMADGFRHALVSSGSPQNVMIRRGGATSEMDSIITLEEAKIIGDAAGIARDSQGQPMMSMEVVVIAGFVRKNTGKDGLVQVRGATEKVLNVRDKVHIKEGRMFRPGLSELVVGSNVVKLFKGFELGSQVKFGGGTWTVVGIMDSGGTSFDSEIWCDGVVLNQTYQRPEAIFQSITARLSAPAEFKRFKDALTQDPRLNLQIDTEIEYYQKQSGMISDMIKVLGFLVAGIMAIGAIIGALNTMYSSISSRSREIGTMRAMGFGGLSVVLSFIWESLLLALAGGISGCILIYPMNGFTASTINFQTFSQLAFAFRITPGLMAWGLVFSLIMGFLGGLPPAVRAARIPIAQALREL
jgi:putative ABC transport system permease protein